LAFTGLTAQTTPLPSVTPEAFPITYFPNTTVAARAALISVEPGKEARADTVLTPVAAVQVRGEVALPNLSAGSFVTLSADGPFGSEPSMVRTPVTGKQFQIPGVPEGRYVVDLTDDENRRITRKVFDVGSSDVTVTLGETPFAHIFEKVEIRGVLKNPNSPTVLLLHSQNLRAPRTLDAEGHAEVAALAPGIYDVTVTKGQPLSVLSMTVQGATQAGGLLNIPETGEVHLTVIADASAGRDIPGRVLRGAKPEGGLAGYSGAR
jgi:hypothetical protein